MQNEMLIMLTISLVSGLIQRLYIRFGPYCLYISLAYSNMDLF